MSSSQNKEIINTVILKKRTVIITISGKTQIRLIRQRYHILAYKMPTSEAIKRKEKRMKRVNERVY